MWGHFPKPHRSLQLFFMCGSVTFYMSCCWINVSVSLRFWGGVQEPRRSRHQVQLRLERDGGHSEQQHVCKFVWSFFFENLLSPKAPKYVFYLVFFNQGLHRKESKLIGETYVGLGLLALLPASPQHCFFKKRVLLVWFDHQILQETCQSCRQRLITLLPAESEYDNMLLRGLCTQLSALWASSGFKVAASAHLTSPLHRHRGESESVANISLD